jgi:DNA-binding response OmpR family regulator
MAQPAAQILVVDDEAPIRTTLTALLERRGYEVTAAATGEDALALIHQRPFDLLLLDLQLPGINGMDVATRARDRQPDAQIIILTGHGSLESAITGLHVGVFDYLLKTADPQEVLARVAAAIHRGQEERRKQELLATLQSVVGELGGRPTPAPRPAEPAEGWIAIGDLQISTWKQVARVGDQTLNLTPTEFRILVCLAQQAGQVMTYQQIVRCAQGYDTQALEAAELIKPHIYHLRQKIEQNPSDPRYILTVRGTGYLLAAGPDQVPDEPD